MSRARICVTIPEELVDAADTRAALEQRSRSWVVTEAVASFTEPPAPAPAAALTPAAAGPDWMAAFQDQASYLAWKARDPDAHRVPSFRESLTRLCDALNRHQARYLVVGTAALTLLSASRHQAGIEILIHPKKKNTRRVLEALTELGSGLAVRGLAKGVRKRAVTVFGGAVRADLLTAARSVTWDQASPQSSVVHVEGADIHLASIGDVVAGGLS